jgi:hypothetical protein
MTWFAPEALSLIVTHRCTAACEHCCFGCSPSVGEAIPIPRLHALVEETRAVPTLRQVVFTGGECFLLGRHLDALIARCRSLDLRTRCVSNGYWAVGPEAARDRTRELRAAGLDELNLSTGPFHGRYVPWERTAWAAAAAVEAGLTGVVVNVEAFQGASLDSATVSAHPALREHVAQGRVRVVTAPWVPAGSEWGTDPGPCALAHADHQLRFQDGRAGPCSGSLRTVSVTPALDLVTCCGLNLEHIPQLHVANLRDRTLAAALAEVPPDLLKMWIHLEGPEQVLAFVHAKDPAVALPLDSAHICHTCQYLFRHARALEVLARHRDEVEARVLERYQTTTAGQGPLAALL